ncbi:UPF0161 protein At3g09310 isoform X1 [Olea europaea var. sylvestris]|uniref:UPF0161 protein At3g09310 isoform X1 n=1 Tax=Olea europaea var. sylvestris TaxID=158386 RepID=UPI000C1D5A6D|nr:UPF0161 protein At3g09310 isoform X1 [Olea europaea var. sylvestris]XP_022853260.1 UPF0161 protein At3g09310 isoform X1 [Olea europaea var. sylvestris]XP_022853261.1 UPF0161 protein At3g09310 isoform X1 [Olea europaea var. sylvestris]
MALVFSLNCNFSHKPFSPTNPNFKLNSSKFSLISKRHQYFLSSSNSKCQCRRRFRVVNELEKDSGQNDDEVNNLGVNAALSMLKFYKREISPLLPNSCRFVPTCSEYSMIAYKKYGVAKGTILTTWRLCRCNPLGGSGFDPPRWFNEPSPPE